MCVEQQNGEIFVKNKHMEVLEISYFVLSQVCLFFGFFLGYVKNTK